MSTALDYYAEGDLWRDKTARLALPVVLWCAKFGHKITYGQLAQELELRHGEKPKGRMTLYGMPAGKIGTLMEDLGAEWGEQIPPVNALIVNKDTGLPGDGADSFMSRYLTAAARRRLTSQNRSSLAEEVIQSIFDYPNWDAVARHFGITALPPVEVLEEEEALPIALPDPTPVRGGGGESEQHQRLKEWVAGHPERFAEFGTFKKGHLEILLHSGDEVDVLFGNPDTLLAAEVKAANAPDSELMRGIFQCVKYRAVLRAMRLAEGEHPTAHAVLVVERNLPADLARLAKRLRVRCFVVKVT